MPGPISLNFSSPAWPTNDREVDPGPKARLLQAPLGSPAMRTPSPFMSNAAGVPGTRGAGPSARSPNTPSRTTGATLLRGTTGRSLADLAAPSSKPSLGYRQKLPPATAQSLQVAPDPSTNTASITAGKNLTVTATGGIPDRGAGFLQFGVGAKLGPGTTVGGKLPASVGDGAPGISVQQSLGRNASLELDVDFPSTGTDLALKAKLF